MNKYYKKKIILRWAQCMEWTSVNIEKNGKQIQLVKFIYTFNM